MQKIKKETLTKKHGAAVLGRLMGKSWNQIGREEGVSYNAIKQRFKLIRPFLREKTLKRIDAKYDKNLETLLALRQEGKTLSQIGAVVGLDYREVHRRLRIAVRGSPETAVKLALGGSRESHEKIVGIKNREKAVKVFFEELARASKPYGVLKRAAVKAGFKGKWSKLTYHLTTAGINWRGELHRRRINLAQQAANTMHLSREEAAQQMKLAPREVDTYRRMARNGYHVHGALELVENPESQQWWDLQMPQVREHLGGPARINLTIRNETVRKDLEMLISARKAARERARLQHDDALHNRGNPKARENYETAIATMKRLGKAHDRYKEKELKFRRTYKLPIPEFLK